MVPGDARRPPRAVPDDPRPAARPRVREAALVARPPPRPAHRRPHRPPGAGLPGLPGRAGGLVPRPPAFPLGPARDGQEQLHHPLPHPRAVRGRAAPAPRGRRRRVLGLDRHPDQLGAGPGGAAGVARGPARRFPAPRQPGPPGVRHQRLLPRRVGHGDERDRRADPGLDDQVVRAGPRQDHQHDAGVRHRLHVRDHELPAVPQGPARGRPSRLVGLRRGLRLRGRGDQRGHARPHPAPRQEGRRRLRGQRPRDQHRRRDRVHDRAAPGHRRRPGPRQRR